MRKLSHLKYSVIGGSVIGAVAMLGAGACSSPAGTPDGDDPVAQFGQPGGGGSSGAAGTTGQTSNTAGAGTSSGGTEGVTNPVLNGGAGTTGSIGAAGSVSMEAVEDVAPQVIPPSYFVFGSWKGYAFTYADSAATTRSVIDYSAQPANQPYGIREFGVRDINGVGIVFGQEIDHD